MSDAIYIDEKILQYITAIVAATNANPRIKRGPPPAVHAQIVDAAQAQAQLDKRKYVTPYDIKQTVVGQLRGKIIWNDDVAPAQVDDAIRALLDSVEVP